MECTWDISLLQRVDQLPLELRYAIQHGSNEQYLEALTKAALDVRYTHTIFAHCEDLFAHVCASLRVNGCFASAIAVFGRLAPCASYLIPYAEQLLAKESYSFSSSSHSGDEDVLYLLGFFRLLASDVLTFKKYVKPAEITMLLRSPNRPVVYLAIRVLQLYLSGADHWFEEMVRQYLGPDTSESNINGQWDNKVIDYRFLTLWEEERHAKMVKFMAQIKSQPRQSSGRPPRLILEMQFDPATAFIGGILLPRDLSGQPIPQPTSTVLAASPTTSTNVKRIACALKSSHPVLLTGLAGSGKTLLVRHAAQKLGKLDKMVSLHLNEQSDAKLLIGLYTTGDNPGSFIWKPGVLATAVQEGRWVLIEDIDRAPREIIATLLPLIEKGQLLIPSRKETIHAAQGFRIIATTRSAVNHRGEETKPLTHILGARHWNSVAIEMPSLDEQGAIAAQLFPSLNQLLPQFIAVYKSLHALRQHIILVGQSKVGTLRTLSPRDLLKWCSRATKLLENRSSFTTNDIDEIFLEALDCFNGALPDGSVRTSIAVAVAKELCIDPQRRDYLIDERDVRYEAGNAKITIGRYNMLRTVQAQKAVGKVKSSFSTNPHTCRMLEKVAAAAINREPLLLVGETGVGKTTAVQHLASHLGKKLVAFNLSQQSEAGDLLGGFKPISIRNLIVPMKDEFDELFTASFSVRKNQKFLDLLGKQMAKSNWKAVCKLWREAFKMLDQQRLDSSARRGATSSKKRKVETGTSVDLTWDSFRSQVADMERRLATHSEAFAFAFIEGNIVKAARNGDWVLLDEINLASPDTLEALVDLLDPSAPSIMLTEAGNIERVKAHDEFRVFAAMNPATDIGKKDLPPGIRSCFTELYVESPDKDIKSLQSIVCSYLRREVLTDQAIALDVSTLYQKIIQLAESNELVDGAGQRPHFSLRTLTRTLSYAISVAPFCSLRRALFEGFQMSFLTFLDAESAGLIHPLIEQHLFGKRTNSRSELKKALRKPNDGNQYVQGYPGSKHWVRQGSLELEDQPHYILTPFIRSNMENLVRAASTRQFPVLIQGPTSSGKTSMIEYLARRTGHKFVRINNHEHTDLQEYLGTYISGTDGRLQFQDGVLVRALREGHWIVLDELNLAPTDVLEALNRLLDDNRELLVPETQEVVRPHENFMLFATQNPAGLYGGRKTLSRAFRNRFLELHFNDIPVDELQDILHQRTQLPESRCKRIVTVYRELSILRQENRLFEQKSFATLRDLFRWALRPNDTIEQLAANGFMLLAERVRKPEEREVLKGVIERAMSTNGPRVLINENELYAEDCTEIIQYNRDVRNHGTVWTKSMRRLYVLVSRAIQNNEPVLLVGETGCGKTTVCQMMADALGRYLHTVNAHQNTETGDLIGSQRPLRNRAVIEHTLRQQLFQSPLLQSVETAAEDSTDALLNAYDCVVASLQPSERETYLCMSAHAEINASRTRYRALFEWVDGNLIQAMKEGALFLLDEISLAEDSVLERINSVLEFGRSILLAEKGSLDSYVTAVPNFQFFATMNPGGDYGKRELSPALRNRFTEIWVPSLNDTTDVLRIASAKLVSDAKYYASTIVCFAQWFKERYNTSANSSISIRDVLSWIDFVNAFAHHDKISAVVHGAALVYIDTLGANPAGLMTLNGLNLTQERGFCWEQLGHLLTVDISAVCSAVVDISVDKAGLMAGPFTISSKATRAHGNDKFSFDPPTTKLNVIRVVRAMQLPKPIMLEGDPGVGKTALITAIAKTVGAQLTRINLSEQTDLIDLFGSDVPVDGAETGTFAWRDAPFLRAMKNGEWVLLDEMNLASQSILEGLNACLDHRGHVFVPELGQKFTRHPDFRLFAAQNPHQQGGGRKGLPASFVNRFTVVYADAFRSEDLTMICRQQFPQIDSAIITEAVQFINILDLDFVQNKRIGTNGGPWEFNLRDISRWLTLIASTDGLLQSGTSRDFVDFLFLQRFRSVSDGVAVSRLFSRIFHDTPPASDVFSSLSSQTLQCGLALLPRDPRLATCQPLSALRPSNSHFLHSLQSLMLCVKQKWPAILIGSSGAGKTSLIERLASAVGAPVVTITMSAETDAMDLIGGYEQADPNRKSLQLLDQLGRHVHSLAMDAFLRKLPTETIEVISALNDAENAEQLTSEILAKIEDILQSHSSAAVHHLLRALKQSSTVIEKARFEWIDGLLVDALREGKWLILDNANLASPSVLDRLNSLLEPDGNLLINEHSNEDGLPQVVDAHPDFRIFLTVDPHYGELSRAMRNRAVELYLPTDTFGEFTASMDPLKTESVVARFRQANVLRSNGMTRSGLEQASLVCQDHFALVDGPLTSRFWSQLANGLYGLDITSMPGWNSVWPLLEDDRSLRNFYSSTISQLQAPADFASVQVSCSAPHVSIDKADGRLSLQTFHPLNNQALVQTSQHTVSQAFHLAAVFDMGLYLTSMRKALALAESNQAVLSNIRRLERSSGLTSRNSKTSGVVELLREIFESFSHWLQHKAIPSQSCLFETKSVWSKLWSLWMIIYELIKNDQFDITTVIACLCLGEKVILRSLSNLPPGTEESLVYVRKVLCSFKATPLNDRGLACHHLWKALRPVVPADKKQLEGLLNLETLVDKFDLVNNCCELPLENLVDLRMSFSRTLGLAASGDSDVEDLSAKLLAMMNNIDNTSQAKKFQYPHFVQSFEGLNEHFSIHCLNEQRLPTPEKAALEILACQSTKHSVLWYLDQGPFNVRERFRILSAHISSTLAGHSNSASILPLGIGLLQQLQATELARLDQLDLLKIETKALGHIVASHADMVASDALIPLDAALKAMTLEVLKSLSSGTGDAKLRAIAETLLASMNEWNSASNVPAQSSPLPAPHHWIDSIRVHLHAVVDYLLVTYPGRQDKLPQAAKAWSCFAAACLLLYTPGSTFDPALEPILEREIHRRRVDHLSFRLEALHNFRKGLTGQPECMRSRTIQADILNLGQEPKVDEVCRPSNSQLPQLFKEFNSLMRTLEPLFTFENTSLHVPLGRTILDNVVTIRNRLVAKYRVYSDLITPFVGFIDCLLTGQRLATQATKSEPKQGFKGSLGEVVPFFKGTLDAWISDHTFVKALFACESQKEQLCWLEILTLRSSMKPFKDNSQELQKCAGEVFSRFYAEWRSQLNKGQLQATTKSSLYKFKSAAEDLEETTQEELDELFPAADLTSDPQAAQIQELHMQGFASTINRLHYNLFSPRTLDYGSIAKVLQEYANIEATSPSDDDISSLLPQILMSLQVVNSHLSGESSMGSYHNVYTEGNIDEATKLTNLVKRVIFRFTSIRSTWPEHATPMEVLLLCDQLLEMRHSAPLTQFLPLVEKLHATVNEWQKIASREFSVGDLLEDVGSLVIRWRQLELSTWATLFDREWKQCEATAASWWYVAYEAIIAATVDLRLSADEVQQHARTLLETLNHFLNYSGLGEFSARLQMLRGFERHTSAIAIESSTFDIVRQALANLISHYEIFETPVAEALSRGRESLEKDVKKVIQLASWKDRNIDVLRQSAHSSHKKLLRLVKKYRSLLTQPISSIIGSGLPDKRIEISRTAAAMVDFAHIPKFVDVSWLDAWQERPERFRNVVSTSHLLLKKFDRVRNALHGAQKLASFSTDLGQSIKELQEATPQTLKEENKSFIGHLKTRKRRLLADVLKEVRNMGFQSSLSDQILAKQQSLEIVLAQAPSFGVSTNTSADHEFHRLLDIMPGVRESARKHSEELTPAEVARCRALLESMLQVSIAQRKIIASSLGQLADLEKTVTVLHNFANCSQPKIEDNSEASRYLRSSQITWLVPMLQCCLHILEAQARLSGNDYTEVVQALDARQKDLVKLRDELNASPQLPDNIQDDGAIAFRNQTANLKRKVVTAIENAIAAHPEASPVLSQLLKWISHEPQDTDPANVDCHATISSSAWVAEFLESLDSILTSIQKSEKIVSNPSRKIDETMWLLSEQKLLESLMQVLQVDKITKTTAGLLSSLQRTDPNDRSILSLLADICYNLIPLLYTYKSAVESLIHLSSDLHTETTRTAYKLASSFVRLAKQGFCSPSGRSENNEEQKGNIESGTGLGEGEGAEDISKDIGHDEDLSDLAQENDKERQPNDIENAKDAVDMADEEFDGDLGDTSATEEENEEGSEAGDDNAELDEELGEIDDLSASAVDEKMWDSSKEQMLNEKETDSGKGAPDKNDFTAGGDQKSDEKPEDQQEDAMDEIEATFEETENLGCSPAESVDSNVQDQQNLDLPEDIDMDDNQPSQGDTTDLESLPEEQKPENDGLHDPNVEENAANDNDDDESAESIRRDAESASPQAAEGEQTNNPDTDDSDIMMQGQEESETYKANEGFTAADDGNGPEDERGMTTSAGEKDEQDLDMGDKSDIPNRQPGAAGGQSEEEGHDSKSKSDDSATDRQTLPFKQLGDALNDWYRQHRKIEEAKRPSGAADVDSDPPPAPITPNVRFEHLPDDQAAVETQALGTASNEQSTALNDDNGLSIGENDDADLPAVDSEDEDQADSGNINDRHPQLLSNEATNHESGPNAFIGEPSTVDTDLEMSDDLPTAAIGDIENVDNQLTNTHLSSNDVAEEQSRERARELWAQYEEKTRNLALVLTEHLRLILQPTQATKMRGDFRTGKRLNIKKIIPYIASSYKRDKIWMRRSIPTKRSYQVMLAIDDSRSMAESGSQYLALETLALVAKSMSMLEVGELSVIGFGEDIKVAYDFSTAFSSDVGVEVFKRFSFAQTKTNVRKLLAESIELLRAARLKAAGSTSDLWQLQLIISDGVCEDHPSIRQLIRQANEERIMMVFIIIDAALNTEQSPRADKQSILDLQTAEFVKDASGEMQLKMVKYLDTFPFQYYLIVRDVQELPGVLAAALRQWFAEVVETSN